VARSNRLLANQNPLPSNSKQRMRLRRRLQKAKIEPVRASCRLPLRNLAPDALRRRLEELRLERAIGVIYHPESERASHYFQANLPGQFDEYIWFDQSTAVTLFGTTELEGLPSTYPFGL